MSSRLFILILLGAAHPALPAQPPLPAATAPLDRPEPWREPFDAAAARNHADEYAWRLFVALNWPASADGRYADRHAVLGADRPVVWENWRNAGEVYLPGGADPGPCNDELGPLSAERRFETLSFTDGRARDGVSTSDRVSARDTVPIRHIVGGSMVPLTDAVAGARRLTEIRMNRVACDYIRARGLYSIEGQLRAVGRRAVAFPPWAREVKAKWRPIGAAQAGRYHTLSVTLADGSRRLYGLTALHILSKDLPTWFWATFEHVDNPRLVDGDGWRLPSRDRFACPDAADCDRIPAGIGLEGTVWANYRLRGTMTGFVDDQGRPQRLANSELEAGMQQTASCMTCHSRASIGTAAGRPVRLPIFADSDARRGYVGRPDPAWYRQSQMHPLDFVWSLSLAQ